MLPFGREAVFSLLNKQKVNVTSSTVGEIISVDDVMNFVIWVRLFIKQQLVNLPVESDIKKMGAKSSVLQQDNISSIRLETNVKRSSTKRTRHINMRYFYITDKIRSGDVVNVYHPTGELVGDYLNKSLNGTPFKNHRNTIMGVDDESIEDYKVRYDNSRVAYPKRIGYKR